MKRTERLLQRLDLLLAARNAVLVAHAGINARPRRLKSDDDLHPFDFRPIEEELCDLRRRGKIGNKSQKELLSLRLWNREEIPADTPDVIELMPQSCRTFQCN